MLAPVVVGSPPSGLHLPVRRVPCPVRMIRQRICARCWLEWRHELGAYVCFYCDAERPDPERAARESTQQ